MAHDLQTRIARDGFALVGNVVGHEAIEALKAAFANPALTRSERDGETYGARNLFTLEAVRDCVHLPALRLRLAPLFDGEFHAVRAIFFDKTAKANWPVPWHQDLSIAVRGRCEIPRWTNWTIKGDIDHVQAPPEFLAQMIIVRIHLDDCPSDNGPLRVMAGTHLRGRIRQEDIGEIVRAQSGGVVIASTGDVLFMRPLLLHASSQARKPTHRRVLHLEFAPDGFLPPELDWAAIA